MTGKRLDKIQVPKGTADMFEDALKWVEYAETVAFRTARSYGFTRVETPTYEYVQAFAQAAPISEDKCFIFLDKSGRQLMLRSDLNAPLCRAVTNNLQNEPLPIRLFNSQRVFRYRHGAKRREFKMFGLEVFGETGGAADAEVVCVVLDICAELGLSGLSVNVSNTAIFHEFVKILHRKGLCDDPESTLHMLQLQDGQDKAMSYLSSLSLPENEKYLLKKLFCGPENANEQWKIFSAIAQVCEALRPELAKTQDFVRQLAARGVTNVNLKFGNARGAGFYSGLAYRIVFDDGNQEIADGGRYDAFVERLGGKATPATGIGLGVERLARLAKEAGIGRGNQPSKKNKILAYVNSPDIIEACRTGFSALRSRGFIVELWYENANKHKAMKYAAKKECDTIITIEALHSAALEFEISIHHFGGNRESDVQVVRGVKELESIIGSISQGL